MAPTFESSGKELVHNLTSHFVVDESSGHYQHVGIVMLTNQVGYLRNPTETCTDALVLVQRHVDAFTAAADGDTGEYLALLNALSQCMTEIRVVTRVLGVGTVVLIGVALLVEVLLHKLF